MINDLENNLSYNLHNTSDSQQQLKNPNQNKVALIIGAGDATGGALAKR